jgi:hypothetical protein
LNVKVWQSLGAMLYQPWDSIGLVEPEPKTGSILESAVTNLVIGGQRLNRKETDSEKHL